MRTTTDRKQFNKTHHFTMDADKEKCCRKCQEFRRHPDLITFCHYLFGILRNKSEARVWGKNGCDQFKECAV